MRRVFTSHWGLKILSLLLAIVLWLVVLREEKVVTTVHAPVELKNIPPEMMVVNDAEDLISVKLRGAQSLISGFVPSQIELPQRKGNARLRMGENYIPIDPKQISVPRGIEVLGVTPSAIRVVLERLVNKELPIVPRIEGLPPRGFYIKQVTCTPARVQVKGPERALREMIRIHTEPISVDGKTETFRQLVYLESPGGHITWKEEEASRVAVLVEIARKERD